MALSDAHLADAVEALAAAAMGVEAAPAEVVGLCRRLLGSTLASSSRDARRAAREGLDEEAAAFAVAARLRSRVERRGGVGAGLRFEECRLAAARAGELSAGGAERLVETLGLCSMPAGGERRLGGGGLSSVRGSFSRPRPQPREERSEPRRVWGPRAVGVAAAGGNKRGGPADDERLLVRDALFALQGIDGAYVSRDTRGGNYALRREVAPKLHALDGMREICEVGWLYERAVAFASAPSGGGQCLNQSLV